MAFDNHILSRRELLKRAGMLGAAAALSMRRTVPEAEARAPETLTAAETGTLEAIVARLIPSDANGPGALDAEAVRYIDRALGGSLASSRAAYSAGLAAIDAYAKKTKGAAFQRLEAKDQDRVLTDMQDNIATGFTPNSSSFFNLLRNHTIQGTFCDPVYGGNANFAGWDLIGYPGVRLSVTRDQQRMGIVLSPNHRSAYDYGMFSKIGAHLKTPGGMRHGD